MSSQKRKVGLNSVISWGASVVIVGLMFKILHWQGGEIMIAVGLLTESFLFFILGIASMVVEDDKSATGEKGGNALADLLATNITPKVIESLSNGFKQFNNTVAQVNLVAGSTNTTANLLKEMETATGDVKKFRDGMTATTTGFSEFSKSLQAITQMSSASQSMMKEFDGASAGMKAFSKNVNDMNAGFDQFNKTMQTVGQTMQSLNQMSASTQAMMKEFEAATTNMKNYNKNLADLTRVYQAQLDAFKK